MTELLILRADLNDLTADALASADHFAERGNTAPAHQALGRGRAYRHVANLVRDIIEALGPDGLGDEDPLHTDRLPFGD